MKRTVKKGLTAFACAAVFSSLALTAQAHRAWMLPSATVLSGDDPWITVDAAISNDLFYFEHFPMRLRGIGAGDAESSRGPAPALAILAPDGSEAKPANGSMGRLRSTFDLQLTQQGTYKLAVVNRGLFAQFTEDGERRRWRGTAATFADEVPANAEGLEVTASESRIETFVTAGNPTEEVLQPTGEGLELLPVTHPNDLFAGETAEFVFLLDGKPTANVAVTVIPGGNRYRDQLEDISLQTDSEGKVSINWPKPGMYWLEAELTLDEGAKAPATRRRASYVATFEVLAP